MPGRCKGRHRVNVAVEVSLHHFFALVETSHGVHLSWMTELAGALERVTSLFAGGYITESEFASAKAGILGAPLVSNTEMDLEGWNAIEQFPFKSSKEIVGAVIAYKFDAKDGGWAWGTVKSLARTGSNAGLYGVKFVSEQLIRFLELREEDYDTDDIWVQIKRAG